MRRERNKGKTAYLVRIIVAVYLIYLGINLIKDVTTGTSKPDNPMLFIVFGVIFVAVSVFLIIFSIYGLATVVKKQEEEEALEEEKAAEEAAKEEPQEISEAEEATQTREETWNGPMSIAERVKILTGIDREEEEYEDEEPEESEEETSEDEKKEEENI